FGFPNPLIGIAGWAAVFAVGCLVLSGIRLAPWFWIAFTIGVTGALVFVCWLIGQSILVLGTLCPWCMVTWAVTIPLFWAVTLSGARDGIFGGAVMRTIGPAYSWVPLISVVSYLVVAVVAQLRLDLISYL
ncbi:MAG TPA: vitamin K epoxide reductase family protein, partial [Homoserinimonas sp.]|nr:vitamin K epoxide reductase family protein [Homoserinimonas sp.]